MIILTILNTVAIIAIFFKVKIITVTVHRNETFWNKTLIGWSIWINKLFIRIPVRNARRTELKEDVDRMIKDCRQNKIQKLTAMFSWLKTWEEVRQFEKDYKIVDKEIVEKLVAGFVPKQN